MGEADILRELQKISKIITLSNGAALEKELAKYATSDDRKKVWVLIDGNRNSDQISKELEITRRAVDIALQSFENANLIEPRKYGVSPKRILDYVPSQWIELLQKKADDKPTSIEPPQQKPGSDVNG